jgi:hypothetical protein
MVISVAGVRRMVRLSTCLMAMISDSIPTITGLGLAEELGEAELEGLIEGLRLLEGLSELEGLLEALALDEGLRKPRAR